MYIRSVLSTFLLLVPIVSTASEGMIYGAVYECEADEVNRIMAEVCSSRFPELAKQADEALATWRDRNLARANAAAKACSTDMSATSETASTSDREAVRRLITDTKAKMFASFEAEIRKQGAAPCHEAIKQLQTVGGPLEIR